MAISGTEAKPKGMCREFGQEINPPPPPKFTKRERRPNRLPEFLQKGGFPESHFPSGLVKQVQTFICYNGPNPKSDKEVKGPHKVKHWTALKSGFKANQSSRGNFHFHSEPRDPDLSRKPPTSLGIWRSAFQKKAG